MVQSRRDQILAIVRQSENPLDDDEIANLGHINRVYVNTLCRQLEAEGLLARHQGQHGKLVSTALGLPITAQVDSTGRGEDALASRRPRGASAVKQASRIQALIEGFAGWVGVFEASQAFPGPRLYFHERAIERAASAPDRCLAAG